MRGNLKTRKYGTPGTPRKIQITAKTDEEKLKELAHHLYKSVTGSLLYLLKHLRPELSNPIRELSRCMQGPTPESEKEMKRVIKWVIDNQDEGLLIEP